MPLFQIARQNRLTMITLNIDRALIARVGREGWTARSPLTSAVGCPTLPRPTTPI